MRRTSSRSYPSCRSRQTCASAKDRSARSMCTRLKSDERSQESTLRHSSSAISACLYRRDHRARLRSRRIQVLPESAPARHLAAKSQTTDLSTQSAQAVASAPGLRLLLRNHGTGSPGQEWQHFKSDCQPTSVNVVLLINYK